MVNKTVFGTYEWAVKNANYINGCSHDCKYCYSKEMAVRYKRKLYENWKIEEVNLKQLEIKFKKVNGTIMFPSSHDITPENLDNSISFIQKLLEPGNNILIVSKPHLAVTKELCKRFREYKNKILFRFTIGSQDSKVLKYWEPGAPSFEERLDSLKLAYNKGFKTSISCEPMLDNKTIQLVEKLEPYVTDAIWIGKANFLIRRLKMNGFSDAETLQKATKLLQSQNDKKILDLYIKLKDNQKIKWKDSIKKIAKLDMPIEKGLDN